MPRRLPPLNALKAFVRGYS